jgi:branched-chain amino acid transport system ATP-binding protein
MSAVLTLDGISKRFGGVLAVDEFSLGIEQGEILGLIGPNGAGKTTVFNLITQFTTCDSGNIGFLGRDIGSLAPYQINRLGIARTFQNIRLFSGLNVIDNVKVALGESGVSYRFLESLFRLPRVGRQERELEARATGLLELLGIASYAKEQPGSLPYGLQRRLEIARALASKPKLLLLDEPAAGLNPAEVAGITELIKRLKEELDLTIILIEHHMDVVMPICDRIYVLNFGKTIAHGSPQEIQANPEVLTAYLGVVEEEC